MNLCEIFEINNIYLIQVTYSMCVHTEKNINSILFVSNRVMNVFQNYNQKNFLCKERKFFNFKENSLLNMTIII